MGTKKDTIAILLKAAPVAAFFILCVIDILICRKDFGIRHIVVDAMFVTFIFLLRTGARRDRFLSILLPSVASAVWLLSALLQSFGPDVAGIGLKSLMPIIAVFLLSQVDIVFALMRRYRNIRSLFKSSQVIDNIVDFAKICRYLVVYIVCFILAVLPPHGGGAWAIILGILSVAIMGVFCWQMWQPVPKYFFLSGVKYLQVLSMARGKLKDNLVPEDAEGKEMDDTYLKAQNHMRDSRPYLDANLSLDDFARMLGTNKVYLSRAINVVSGRNFCQFVNYYRVQYAKELMKKTPNCKMIEIALESGFHSVVTFNMAFKLNEDATPSEWLRERMGELS